MKLPEPRMLNAQIYAEWHGKGFDLTDVNSHDMLELDLEALKALGLFAVDVEKHLAEIDTLNVTTKE